MNSVIEFIKADLQRHKVVVTLPGESEERELYLMIVSAMVSRFKDFKQTYGRRVKPLHRKIAKKFFGLKETENVYGVFLDADLKMVFAFSREFGDYDRSQKVVVFTDIDDHIAENVKAVPAGKPQAVAVACARPHFPRSGGGSGRMVYSLTEKPAP